MSHPITPAGGLHDDRWQDLIPFYVAGSLPAADVHALERHLAVCADCQQALHEWRIIAESVRGAAVERGRALPPLAKSVRDQLTAPSPSPVPALNGQRAMPPPPRPPAPPTARSMRRVVVEPLPPRRAPRTPLPVTMVAAVLVLLVVGGVLVLSLTRPPTEPQTGSSGGDPNAVAVAPSLTQPSLSPTPTATRPTATPTHTITQEPGILPTRQPSATPAITLSGRADILRDFPAVPTDPPVTPVQIETLCTVTNITGQAIAIYQEPNPESPMTGTLRPGAVLYLWSTSGDGWARVADAQGVVLGWVYLTGLEISGKCAALTPAPTVVQEASLTPTPTAGYGVSIGHDTYDFVVVTNDLVGIPANSRVRISSAYFDGTGWVYSVVAQATGAAADAREWQIRWDSESGSPIIAPTLVPAEPPFTPTFTPTTLP